MPTGKLISFIAGFNIEMEMCVVKISYSNTFIIYLKNWLFYIFLPFFSSDNNCLTKLPIYLLTILSVNNNFIDLK